jgi:hypothetical protein
MKDIIIAYNWIASFVLALIALIVHLISFNFITHIVFVAITIYFLLSTFILVKILTKD